MIVVINLPLGINFMSYIEAQKLLLHLPLSIILFMSVIIFTVILLLGSYFAGLLGSLTGLGGGFVIIPLLTLVLHVDNITP